VPIHVASDFYDVAGFKAGRPAVEPFEVEELGALGGLRLVHLQCHFGLDTLDLVRMHPTLEAVGLDFSAPAIAQATKLAGELDLDQRVRFVQDDVRHAATALGEDRFDVIYTGKGALCWLSDLRLWATQCADLLQSGGWLYLCEFHPIGEILDEDEPGVKYDYFRTEPWVDDFKGSYADTEAETVNNISYSWHHPLPEVFGALMGAGFELRFYHEWDYTLFQATDWLVKGDHGRYTWPDSAAGCRLPLMYSLKAQKRT
jgi:SAM-dependent methyltransferase